jgi:phosphate uptake regulator
MEHVKSISNFINEGKSKDMVAELNEMTLGQLERIADYADMIKERMLKGQQPESWMYSQLTIALENLNSVHDAMDGIDGVEEVSKPYNP